MLSAVAESVDRERYPHRMRDLCRLTGLPRQVIHFYIQQGLVPEGAKTGRNMAYYGDEHVERIRLVRKLQAERFLPLKVIGALLDERDEAFTPAQQRQLGDVLAHLGPTLRPRADRPDTVSAADTLSRLDLTDEDLQGFVDLGLLAEAADPDGRAVIARDDVWLLELWAELRRAGFTAELGFRPRDLAVHEAAIAAMIKHESQLLATRVSHLPPAKVAAMLETALPLLNAFLVRYHLSRARDLVATLLESNP